MSDKFTTGQKTVFSVIAVSVWFAVTLGLIFGLPFEDKEQAAGVAVAWMAASIAFLFIGIQAWADSYKGEDP